MKLHRWFRARTAHSTSQRTPHCRPAVEVLEGRALLSVFAVLNTDDSGPDSLRQAILDANEHVNDESGPDVVQFAIGAGGVQTIALASLLPRITDAVTIDGWSEPGFAGTPLIELNGAETGAGDGLVVKAPNTTIRGLAINRFSSSGIVVDATENASIYGNFIGVDPTGTIARANIDSNVECRFSSNVNITDNLLSGGSWYGIMLFNVAHVVVQGNRIGTNADGTTALDGATVAGISMVYGTHDVVIGGPNPGAANLISGNPGSGILAATYDTHDVTIQGNIIGADLAGTVAIPNGEGVRMTTSNAVITDNLISGNAGSGVTLLEAAKAVMRNNTIGANLEGTSALANQGDGIWCYASADSTIMGNLISGNTERGIAIMGSRTHGCVIQGNTIGANRSGTAVIGNGQDGVLIYQAHDNLIGGSGPGQGNIIAGNGGDGLQFAVAAATGNVVQGNAIGTNFTGALNLGNAGSGVYVWANNLLIGGTSAGEGNTIAYNGLSGVLVALASAVAIRGNSIHDNSGLGIELYGAGNGQNAPVLTTTGFGARTYVAGNLINSGSPNSRFTLEFYANAATDASGFGEGDRFLGAITIITDGAGKADFSGVLPSATASGEFITATAIDAIGNTSVFSRRVVALTPAA